jgi:hypothetical protein
VRTLRSIIAVGVLTAVVGVGVGVPAGGASAATVPRGGDALSARAWRARANALCRAARRRTDVVQRRVFHGLERDEQPSLQQVTAYVKGLAPIARGLAADIAALDAPKSLSTKVDRFVATMRRDLRRVVADPSRGLESDPFTDTSLRAHALALRDCE